jgi:hypothetical protein
MLAMRPSKMPYSPPLAKAGSGCAAIRAATPAAAAARELGEAKAESVDLRRWSSSGSPKARDGCFEIGDGERSAPSAAARTNIIMTVFRAQQKKYEEISQ